MKFKNEKKEYKVYKDPRDKKEEMISKKSAIKMTAISVASTVVLIAFVGPLSGLYGIVSRDTMSEIGKFKKLYLMDEIIHRDYYKKPDDKELADYSVKGLVAGLDDVYSEYYTKEEMEKLTEVTSGSFVGMGAYIGVDQEDGKLIVSKPFKGSPAEKAGIKPGDKLLKVGDLYVNYKNMDEAIKRIRGKKGTSVNLLIERGPKIMNVKVVRDVVVEQSIESKMLEDDIGYIKITSFIENTSKDFDKAFSNLKKQHMKGLIIDVRDNGGGLLDSVKSIADDLVGKETIVYTKDNKGNKEYLKGTGKRIDIPVAILTNGNSASASEILTGAIVDNKIGVSVGTTTFGKGLVQSVSKFMDGTGYKLTTAQYFTPSGAYINKKGIKPNIEEKDEKQQLPKAIEYIREQIAKTGK